MALPSLKDVDVSGKRVLVRVDFNVQIKDDGRVGDLMRLEESMETIHHLLERKARVVLLSHLGRPQGRYDEKFSLKPVAKALSGLLQQPVQMAQDCVGDNVKAQIEALNPGEVLLLENSRFHPEDEKNSPEFAKQLASLADVYVNEAFGTCHRAHASVMGVPGLIPHCAGFLLAREIEMLSKAIHNPAQPVVVLIGGAKMDTKVDLVRSFLDKADVVMVGGGIANTFLAAQGYNVGKSLCEGDKLKLAQEILLEAERAGVQVVLPRDVIVASELSNEVETLDVPVADVEGDMKIFDIGEKSRVEYAQHLESAGTIIWNGPVGVFEYPLFEEGTEHIAQTIANCKQAVTILGGGDTIDALRKFEISRDRFTHVSTGGGAMLKFLSREPLPGVEALKKA